MLGPPEKSLPGTSAVAQRLVCRRELSWTNLKSVKANCLYTKRLGQNMHNLLHLMAFFGDLRMWHRLESLQRGIIWSSCKIEPYRISPCLKPASVKQKTSWNGCGTSRPAAAWLPWVRSTYLTDTCESFHWDGRFETQIATVFKEFPGAAVLIMAYWCLDIMVVDPGPSLSVSCPVGFSSHPSERW